MPFPNIFSKNILRYYQYIIKHLSSLFGGSKKLWDYFLPSKLEGGRRACMSFLTRTLLFCEFLTFSCKAFARRYLNVVLSFFDYFCFFNLSFFYWLLNVLKDKIILLLWMSLLYFLELFKLLIINHFGGAYLVHKSFIPWNELILDLKGADLVLNIFLTGWSFTCIFGLT